MLGARDRVDRRVPFGRELRHRVEPERSLVRGRSRDREGHLGASHALEHQLLPDRGDAETRAELVEARVEATREHVERRPDVAAREVSACRQPRRADADAQVKEAEIAAGVFRDSEPAHLAFQKAEAALADFLEVPVSPVTGTRFENARSTKTIHICEFTADLIHHGKLKLDPSRNDHWNVTFHDSCNPARAMGLLEEPRFILRSVCNQFHEMPENTIREQTFCCGSGSGLGTDENLEMRLRGGFPRANAVKYVRDKYGVNVLACICAIDKAVLPPLLEYWVPGVDVAGVHELVGNALVMKGEKERPTDLRGTPLKMKEAAAHA